MILSKRTKKLGLGLLSFFSMLAMLVLPLSNVSAQVVGVVTSNNPTGSQNIFYGRITGGGTGNALLLEDQLYNDLFRVSYNGTVSSAGSIGIGTAAPGYPLDIYNASGENGVRMNVGGNLFYMSHGGWSMGAGRLGIGDGTAPSIVINASNDNVGIGTNNPGVRLDINGGSGAALRILGGGDLVISPQFFGSNATLYNDYGALLSDVPFSAPYLCISGVCQSSWASIASQWFTNGSSISYNVGNVGIGSASPAYSLDIGGNMRTTGRYYSNEWIQMDNFSGLYSPNNGAHLYPNNGSYGAWRVAGNRNGWYGLEFDTAGGQTSFMMGHTSQGWGAQTTGVHNNTYGWLWSFTHNRLSAAGGADFGGGSIITTGNVGIGTTDVSTYKIYGKTNLGGWGYRFDNDANGSNVYMAHGGGYGMHVNAGSNASASTYLLELYSANGINSNSKLQVMGNGNIVVNGSTVIDGNAGWHRTYGDTGWYNGTYGGGWYMADSSWIRSYGNKNIYQNTGVLRTDGTLQVGPNGDTFVATSGGNVGVGTASPTSKLHVQGNFYTVGNATVTGNISSLGGNISTTGTISSTGNISTTGGFSANGGGYFGGDTGIGIAPEYHVRLRIRGVVVPNVYDYGIYADNAYTGIVGRGSASGLEGYGLDAGSGGTGVYGYGALYGVRAYGNGYDFYGSSGNPSYLMGALTVGKTITANDTIYASTGLFMGTGIQGRSSGSSSTGVRAWGGVDSIGIDALTDGGQYSTAVRARSADTGIHITADDYGIYEDFTPRNYFSGMIGVGTDVPSSMMHVIDSRAGDAPAIAGIHSVTNYSGVGVYGEGKWKGVEGTCNSGTGHCYGAVFNAYTPTGGTAITYGVSASGGNYGIVASGGTYAGYFYGNVHVTGTLSKEAGSFKIDYPADPKNKVLQHSFVESPEMRNMYYGQAETKDGVVEVSFPEWWIPLNGTDKAEYNYQFTPIGKWCSLYVSQEVEDGKFKVASNDGDCKFSWTVSAVRHDAYAEANRIKVVDDKKGDEKGKCLFEGACK